MIRRAPILAPAPAPAPAPALAPPRPARALALLGALLFTGPGCDGDRRAPTPAATPKPTAAAAAPAPAAQADMSYAVPGAPRVVAIGDLHGDLAATRAALRLAGAIDDGDRWIGGNLVVVQTGDQLDRGDQERAILDLLDRLAAEARAAGGAMHVLNGNHELMNAQLDFRYVTEGGYKEFEGVPGADKAHPAVQRLPEAARARAAAFLPGVGPYTKKLATRPVVLMVGDTIFVHGGVLPAHGRYGIARINREVQTWLDGKSPPPAVITAEDSPVWTRRYGAPDLGPDDCEVLDRALAAVSAKRMVVGHTVQKGGITSACNGKVWRIDCGLAAHYGGPTQVLELAGEAAQALKMQAAPAAPAAPGKPGK